MNLSVEKRSCEFEEEMVDEAKGGESRVAFGGRVRGDRFEDYGDKFGREREKGSRRRRRGIRGRRGGSERREFRGTFEAVAVEDRQ